MRRPFVFTLAALLLAVSASAQDDPWFGPDKALHAAAGAAIGAGGYGAGALLVTSRRARIGIGVGLALGAGAAKEWHDRGGRGTPSWRDFAWDGVGAAAGVTLAWLIDHARHSHHATTTLLQDSSRAVPSEFGEPSGARTSHGASADATHAVRLDASWFQIGWSACCQVTP